ncbi:MAG: alpha/beta hydrolase-fold protein [Ginsengibacter sp.]
MAGLLKQILCCFFLFMMYTTNAQFSVTFSLKNISASHIADTFFITGNFNAWDPGNEQYSLRTGGDGSAIITLLLQAGNYEYKFTRGSWAEVETNAEGKNLLNRSLVVNGNTSVEVEIAGWVDDFTQDVFPEKKHTASQNVRIIDTAFYMPQLHRSRRIWLYLPPGYESTKEKYPVIYMHDGQNLFDEATSFAGEWGIDEYLDSIYSLGKKSAIIVGIDNGQVERMAEYNPYTFQQFGEGEGDKYVDFLVKNLKPYIDRNYRTLKNKQNTFIAGSSMGGLISFYAILKYPKVFGGAGAFSPAFWTAPGIDSMVRTHAAAMSSRIFFYAGGKEGNSMLPNMERIANETRQYSRSNIKEVIDPEAQHNEAAWKNHFPQFYEWVILKKPCLTAND